MGFSELLVPRFLLVALLALHALHVASSSSSGAAEEAKKLYIVYLGERQHEDADLVTASHHGMLASILGSKEEALESIVYSYKHGFSGFSAMLTESHARKIAALSGVLSVTQNQIYHTHTTRSWDFLGLTTTNQMGCLQRLIMEMASSLVSSTRVSGQNHRALSTMVMVRHLQNGRESVRPATPSAPTAATARSSVHDGTPRTLCIPATLSVNSCPPGT